MERRYPAVSADQLQLIPYVFMDAGNAYRELRDFDPFNVKRSVGVGARIFLPILGLVDICYGYRLYCFAPHAENSKGVRVVGWDILFNIVALFTTLCQS